MNQTGVRDTGWRRQAARKSERPAPGDAAGRPPLGEPGGLDDAVLKPRAG